MISLKGGGRMSGMSPSELQKLGASNVGEVLNKIADPGWVDPSKQLRAVGDGNLNKDAFLKLMLTQLQNQDPTSPLESHEMAAQLAQFTSLEQLQNINMTLEDMRTAQKPNNDFQAMQFIGKVVSGDSARITRTEFDNSHEFAFNLPENASDVTLKVINPLGETIRTYTLKDLKQGENSFSWNGRTEQDVKTGAGEYRFEVEATTAHGKKLAVDTSFEGRITGMNYTAEGPVLLIGNKSIKLRDVRKITDPSIKQNDQKAGETAALDLSENGGTQQNKNSNEVAPSPGNLSKVGMDRGMLNKINTLTK